MINREDYKILLKEMNVTNLENIVFKHALTHPSYANENNIPSYETLDRSEFLGDAVIGKLISEFLFLEKPKINSGTLSLLRASLISEESFSKIAKNMNLEKYCFLGKGENREKLPISIYADMFESLIGAIFLADGETKTKEVLEKYLFPKIIENDDDELKDYKTKLQEFLSSNEREGVTYKTTNTSNKVPYFESKISNENFILGIGHGRTKKEAEKQAAKDAYVKLVK